MSTIKAFADHAMNAASHLFERQGELLPMWLGLTEETKEIMVFSPPFPFSSNEAKEVAVSMAKAVLVPHCDYIAFMVEAWTKSAKDGEHITKMPSEYADREEVIHLFVESKSGELVCLMRRIERDADGKPTLAPITEHSTGEFGGRFVGMFGQQQKTKH